MFKVQPVHSPELGAALAEALGGDMIPNTFSFCALELEDDMESVRYPIALCQFSFTPEAAVISSLLVRNGSENDEAVTVLVRSVMSWLYRAEIPVVYFADGAAEEDKIKSYSFRRDDSGRYAVDLKKFYRSPCSYNKENK